MYRRGKILGTGGALSQLRGKTKHDLIVMNSDSFIKCDLSEFLSIQEYINIIMFFLQKTKVINQIKFCLILTCKKNLY